MSDLHKTLPDLMRRATENVVPESTDLLERGMRRGMTLRRRRSALLGLTGGGAVLAVVAGVLAVPQLLGDGSTGTGTVAGMPSTSVRPSVKPPTEVTPSETFQTLKKLLPDGLRFSEPRMRYDEDEATIEVSVLVDDGKGVSYLSVQLGRYNVPLNCADKPHNCRIRSDGSTLTTSWNRPGKHDDGHINHHAVVYRTDGTGISVASTNSAWPDVRGITRPQPMFSVAQLTRMADSKLWRFPSAKQR